MIVTTGGQQAIDLVAKTLVDPGDVVICEAPDLPGRRTGLLLATRPRCTRSRWTTRACGSTCSRSCSTGSPRGPRRRSSSTRSRPSRTRPASRCRPSGGGGWSSSPGSASCWSSRTTPTACCATRASRSSRSTSSTAATTCSTSAPSRRSSRPASGSAGCARRRRSWRRSSRQAGLRPLHLDARPSTSSASTSARAAGATTSPTCCGIYRERRDAMLDALERHFPDGATWSPPEGGLFCWATLPDYIDTTDLLAKALRENVAFVPGAAAYVDGRGGSSMRLNFSASDRGRDPRGHPPDRRSSPSRWPLRDDHRRAQDPRPRASSRSRGRACSRCAPVDGGDMKVAVLKGGRALERAGVAAQRRAGRGRAAPLGHDVAPLDVGADLVATLNAERPDVAFVALHGRGRRGRHRPGAARDPRHPLHRPGRPRLRALRSTRSPPSTSCAPPGCRPPTGSPFNAGRLPRARRRRRARGDRGQPRLPARGQAGAPAARRSGVRFAAGPDEVPAALVAAFSYDDRVLLERHRRGRELAVSLLNGDRAAGGRGDPRDEDRFNYEARYEIGRTDYALPGRASAPREGRSSTPRCAPGTCSGSTASAAST